MGLRGIPQRRGVTAVIVIGNTCVVAVMLAMLSLGTGVRAMNQLNARADRVMIMAEGAQNISASNLETGAARIIMDTAGIKRDSDGKPLATAVTMVMAEARKKADNSRVTFPLLGVDDRYFKVYPELGFTAGRMFQPALNEIVVSQSRYELYRNFEVGDKVRLRGADWTIVGRYLGSGTSDQSIIADVDTVKSLYKRNTTQVITAVLESPAALKRLQDELKANPNVKVEVKPELEVLEDLSKGLTGLMDFVSYFVAVVMGIGATLGAINVMYAVVDGRKREMATLRAMGFGGGPIVFSVLVESILLAIPGALLGVLIAWVSFNGDAVSTSGLIFHLTITPVLIALGMIWAVTMGLLGGLTPAIRAARVPVATALRAT